MLANGYVDLGTWWCVTPFIGAGVGTARVTIANYTDHRLVNNDGFGFGAFPSLCKRAGCVEVEFCVGGSRRFGLHGQSGPDS